MGNICSGERQSSESKLAPGAKQYKKPKAVKKAHDQITKILGGNKTLSCKEKELQDIGSILKKMDGRHDRANCAATLDHVFQIANGKIDGDENKKVLEGLRSMVRTSSDGSTHQN